MSRLFVITGPSGAGKGSVIKKLLEIRNDLFLSISSTTRTPRGEEVDGKDYFFLSTNEFEEGIKQNNFLEYAYYIDNYYGTPKDKITEMLSLGKNVILEIETDGALQVIEKMKDAILIFLSPPSIEELAVRLRGRGTESGEKITKRLEKAKVEMSLIDKFHYNIINDDILVATDKINKIIGD